MIGLLIITHEAIGEAYRSLAQHFFFGDTPQNIRILGVGSHEDHDSIISRAAAMAAELDYGSGVLILTDIFGATPCNAARRLVESGKTAMLTGLNAPMMVKAANYAPAAGNLADFTRMVKEAAINGIIDITSRPEGCFA
ncbi:MULTISPECIES: PTS sugar transporter subunit IIA [Neisseria]|uniref:PTS system fructose IIA component family protein n=1 Tax=Neisseria musculi TaxID=1815583 RepID=A0A7H1MCC3_9NEIS|nr:MULTISPECIES: PTS mannose transporter subunit IIA [Neisseria]MBF0804028.1 PTS mannose transporter subunit IIA [Neisseria sp. 19428wB4_WF04]QNT59288.1 PTS system fructose IIA component family protein [Neisseria musculi]TFU43233.1 PTS mannose transporter subunit IIA [Neisseria sp. WF04]